MPRPEILSAHCFDQWRRPHRGFGRSTPGRRALDESAAEHARLPRGRIIEHAGLAGGYALFAGDQFDLITAISGAQPRRLRRAGRSHPDKNLQTIPDYAVERAVADPVD